MVATIGKAATLLGLPFTTHTGAPAWGGHSLRRGGVQHLGKAGVDVWRIQAMARHSSTAILRYLDDSHHARLQDIAAEAALADRLGELQRQVDALQAAGQAPPPLPPQPSLSVPLEIEPADVATKPPIIKLYVDTTSFPLRDFPIVASTRRDGHTHRRDPRTPALTLCGWAWPSSDAFKVFPAVSPAGLGPTAPLCAICARKARRQAEARQPDGSSSASDA